LQAAFTPARHLPEPYSAVMATIAALLTIGSTAFRQLPESPLLRQAGASNKKSI
jgi:hypothetical protein